MWTVPLPFERPPISMNDRFHWAKKAKLTRKVRDAACIAARGLQIPTLERARMTLVWTVPDRRRRDTDNPTPTFKAAVDGMVDAGVVRDDSTDYVTRGETEIVYRYGKRALELRVEAL